jgi:hypothetical protein
MLSFFDARYWSKGTRKANDSLFDVQSRVLRADGLSDAAKLMFCRLMCEGGFRSGWILSDSRWSPDDRCNLLELADAGYVTLESDDDLGTRLAALPMPKEE